MGVLLPVPMTTTNTDDNIDDGGDGDDDKDEWYQTQWTMGLRFRTGILISSFYIERAFLHFSRGKYSSPEARIFGLHHIEALLCEIIYRPLEHFLIIEGVRTWSLSFLMIKYLYRWSFQQFSISVLLPKFNLYFPIYHLRFCFQ